MVHARRNIPAFSYLLMSTLGIASSASLYVWINQYTLFFGKHLVSVSTIAVSILSSMALGSLLIGKLSDKTGNIPVVFSILAGITGIFAVCDPFLFRLLTWIFHQLNYAFNLGPFRAGFFRLVLSMLFLIVPAALMTGFFTLLARYFVRYNDQAGKFMNAMVTSGSAGIVIGLLLTTFCLIPSFGFRITQITAAALFLLSGLMMLLFITGKRFKILPGRIPVMAKRVKKESLLFRKKKTVLETGVKLKRAAMRVYAFQGFSAAALLIIYWRILINYAVIGPVYFYPLVTAVAMAGLTLGCVFFRRVTEKTGNSYLTLATFQILAGLTAVISYLAVYVLLQKFHELLNGTLAFSKMVANHLLLFATLIILPAVLTGATIPLAGKLFSKKLEKTGSSFGRLGFIWFFSAMTGIMLTTYILIPVCGLYYAYFIIVFFLMSSGIYLILRDSRLIRGFRMSYAVMAVLIYFLIIGLIKTFHVDLPCSVSKSKSQVITRLEGSTASLNTIVDAGGNITVMLNNKPVMASDNHGLKTQLIPAYLPLIMSSHIDSALITGFGMGLTAAALESNGVSTIHITEMHPEIIRLSADVFADMNDDILTSSHVNTTIEDARSFLIRSQRKLDLITTGFEQHILDPQYYTEEFYRLCHEKLSDTGLLCQIVPVSGISYNEFRALIRACSDVFREVSLWYLAPEKMLMMGEKTSEKHDFCRIFSRLSDLNLKNDLSSIGIPDAESLLAHLLVDNSQIRRFVDNAPLNLDNRPIIQYSRYTEKDTDKSILMFLNDSRVNYPEFLSTSIGCVPDYAGIQEKADLIIEGLKLRPGEPSNFR